MQHMDHAPLTFRWVLTQWQLCLFQSGFFWVGRWFCLCGGRLGSVTLLSCFLFWAGLALFTVSCLLRYRCWICGGGLLGKRKKIKQTGQQQEEEESGERTERQVKRCPSLTEEPSEDDECGSSVMNREKMDNTVEENRMKVMDGGRKKDSLPALIVSCYLAQLSPCPQRRPWETRSSLQAKKQQLIFFFLYQKLSLSMTFTWAQTLCSDLVG